MCSNYILEILGISPTVEGECQTSPFSNYFWSTHTQKQMSTLTSSQDDSEYWSDTYYQVIILGVGCAVVILLCSNLMACLCILKMMKKTNTNIPHDSDVTKNSCTAGEKS